MNLQHHCVHLRVFREEVIFGMVVVDTTIEGVNPLGPADLNTLQEGDVIVAVDGKRVHQLQ